MGEAVCAVSSATTTMTTAAAGVGEAVCLTASRRRRRRGVIKLTLASWQMRFIQCWGVRNILFFILIPTYVARKDPEALWVQLTEKYVCIVLSLYIDKCHFCEATLFST